MKNKLLTILTTVLNSSVGYELSENLSNDATKGIFCLCKDDCNKSTIIFNMPSEKYPHCLVECMKKHGIVTTDPTLLEENCEK